MKIAFPTDEHVPFDDPRAREVALKIVQDFKPDHFVSGSDGLDFYLLSKFDKNPERAKLGLQHEINAWKSVQREWDDALGEGTEKHFVLGNHEDRLRKYLWKHPEIASLDGMQLHIILGLEGLGYTNALMSKDEVVFNEALVVKHGGVVRKHSGNSARGELEQERFAISTLTGHTHRGGHVYARTRFGDIQACEGFCLCSLNPEYVTHPDWQQGIVLAEVWGSQVTFEPVLIQGDGKKTAIWRGKEYAS
jgi:hypothetical protein